MFQGHTPGIISNVTGLFFLGRFGRGCSGARMMLMLMIRILGMGRHGVIRWWRMHRVGIGPMRIIGWSIRHGGRVMHSRVMMMMMIVRRRWFGFGRFVFHGRCWRNDSVVVVVVLVRIVLVDMFLRRRPHTPYFATSGFRRGLFNVIGGNGSLCAFLHSGRVHGLFFFFWRKFDGRWHEPMTAIAMNRHVHIIGGSSCCSYG